ncbi:hypothetical protein P3T43_000092 [Paraburkholderia sp. GAS41]
MNRWVEGAAHGVKGAAPGHSSVVQGAAIVRIAGACTG